MYNAHPELVVALNSVLPTHYEMALTSKTATPCISYMFVGNSAEATGDTIGYSSLGCQVKVWAKDIAIIMQYAQEIDNVLRPLGWRRTNYNELYDMNSTMIQGIMTYEAIASENY